MDVSHYFDYAATCPPFPEAVQELARVSADAFGNPSSTHELGQQARSVLEGTRRSFAALCGLQSFTLVLTSGGTEANNLVVRSVMDEHPRGRLLLAEDAHASAWFATRLYPDRTDVLPTGPTGRIDPQRLARAVTPGTVLCSVLQGNNETGVVHDVEAIGRFCAGRGILFHCDGVQAVGHIPLNLAAFPFDFYTFASHKFGAPRGSGGVFMKRNDLPSQIFGGGQEKGMRAGTENVAAFAAALTALKLNLGLMEAEIPRLRGLASALVERVRKDIPGTLVNSDMDNGLPGLVSLSFLGVVGESVVTEMNLQGFALSAGSACHAGKVEPSRVILAMGRTDREALGTVRISMGRHTTEDRVSELAAALKDVVERQRALS
jgi:cysteine desulfurase